MLTAIVRTLAADILREAGVPNVVSWNDQQLGPALTAAVCGKAFFSALRNPTATASEVRILQPTFTVQLSQFLHTPPPPHLTPPPPPALLVQHHLRTCS